MLYGFQWLKISSLTNTLDSVHEIPSPMTAVDITVLSLLGVLLLFVIVLPTIAESPRVPEKVRDYIIGLSDKAAKAFFIILAVIVIGIPLAILLFIA